MKAFIFDDLTLFHFISYCNMFLVLMEQANELNGNVAGDSPSLQVNVSFMVLDSGRSSQTLSCLLFDL